jgi:hypothetical protein
MCAVTAKTSNVPDIVISPTDDGRLTPVKHNTTTIKQLLLSMLINWTHFPTILEAPISDQDRAAQVASFCTVELNIFYSPERNIFHATLLTPDILRRLPDFLKIYKPLD